MRININMDENLVKIIDEIASKMYISRSAYISFAVSQKIQQDKLLAVMPEMVKSLPDMIEVAKNEKKLLSNNDN